MVLVPSSEEMLVLLSEEMSSLLSSRRNVPREKLPLGLHTHYYTGNEAFRLSSRIGCTWS